MVADSGQNRAVRDCYPKYKADHEGKGNDEDGRTNTLAGGNIHRLTHYGTDQRQDDWETKAGKQETQVFRIL